MNLSHIAVLFDLQDKWSLKQTFAWICYVLVFVVVLLLTSQSVAYMGIYFTDSSSSML